MKTKSPNTAVSSTDSSDLSPATIFDVLTNDRRRYALHYLFRKVGAIPLGELAEQIALWEDDPTYERYERVLTGLHHVHLPKLTDSGLVRYEIEEETVELLESADQLAPHLKLVAAEDLR